MKRLIIVLLIFLGLSAPRGGMALELDGLIEPHRIIKVGGSGTPGILEAVHVDRGDFIKSGQLLATLQSGVEKATMEIARARAEVEADSRINAEKTAREVARARALLEAIIEVKKVNLDFFQRKQKRLEELFKKNLVPEADLDEAETNRKMAEAQLKEVLENKRLNELEYQRAEAQVNLAIVNKHLAELELKRSIEVVNRLNVRSPIDGVVVERYLSPGEYVEEQPILKLAQVDPLNVEVIAPVAVYLSIKVGMRAKVYPETPIGGEYTAIVKIVDRVVDAASGTFGIRLEMPNPKYLIPAGLKCKVKFLTNEPEPKKKRAP